jgi:hypothetical protein
MNHQKLVAIILTILLVGTIPTTLFSHYNSGLEINIFSNYNIAYAADKTQTGKGIDQGDSPASIDVTSSISRVEKLQQKVKELMVEASKAKIRAANAMNAAGNASEEADSLSSIADEADKNVNRLLISVDDVEKREQNRNETTAAQDQTDNNINDYNNDELNTAVSEAKEKRKAANLSEKHAKDLSDKADSLNEAAKKAEKLSRVTQKDLGQAIRDSDNSNRSEEEQGQELTKGSHYDDALKEAKINALRTRQDQFPVGNTVNDSEIISSQDQFRDRSQEGIPVLNSSKLINRIPLLGEVSKQSSNLTASDKEPSNNFIDMNPFGSKANENINLVSSNANNTVEYEGNVDCKVISDSATTTTTTINSAIPNKIQNDGKNGGCNPQTSMSDRYQYTVWSEGDEDNRFILFKRSVNNKAFENPITLSGDIPSAVFNPKVTTEGDNVYVVWQGDSESGNQDILMRKSENNGQSFGDVINLSNDRAGSGNPEINVNSSNVYVVWDGTTPGNNDIYMRKSINNGTDFDKVKNLSTNEGVSYEPKVVLDKKGLEIYWRDYRNGHEEILAKKSLNEGRTFEIMKNLDKDVLDLWEDRAVSAGRS